MPYWEMIAEGRVQGVGFRWFVLDCALRFGIKGFVRNQYDGTVYILAGGDEESLRLFAQVVKQGNAHAIVKELTIDEHVQSKDYEDFFIA